LSKVFAPACLTLGKLSHRRALLTGTIAVMVAPGLGGISLFGGKSGMSPPTGLTSNPVEGAM
jgi:hypothetical protein